MDKYDALRESITLPMVVEAYMPTVKITRRRIPCPFHGGKHDNLAMTDRVWYCHVCHAGGDVIDFVRRLFNLRFPETVMRLSADFGIPVGGRRVSPVHEQKMLRELTEMQKRREEAVSFSDEQTGALSDLRRWLNDRVGEDAQGVICDIDALLDRHLMTNDLFTWDTAPLIAAIKERYKEYEDGSGNNTASRMDA